MPSDSWLNGWLTGDIVPATEFAKGTGAFYDSTLGTATASFDITSVPTWGTNIRINLLGRGDTAALATGVIMRFNNDSAANYSSQQVTGIAAVASAAEINSTGSPAIGSIAASSATVSFPGGFEAVIPNFRTTAFFKQAYSFGGAAQGIVAASRDASARTMVWANTAAITRITLLPQAGNFITGSRCTAYVTGP